MFFERLLNKILFNHSKVSQFRPKKPTKVDREEPSLPDRRTMHRVDQEEPSLTNRPSRTTASLQKNNGGSRGGSGEAYATPPRSWVRTRRKNESKHDWLQVTQNEKSGPGGTVPPGPLCHHHRTHPTRKQIEKTHPTRPTRPTRTNIRLEKWTGRNRPSRTK